MSNRFLQNIQKLSPEEKQKIFEQVQRDIEKREKRKRIYWSVSAVACVVLLLMILRTSLYENPHKENLLVAADSSLINPKDIQLVLADKTITFEKDVNIKYNDKGEIITDSGDGQIKTETAETTLNTLIVPKGKRSGLTLADGSKVWVNSGSTLRFPARFHAEKREIWLDGEIYIEVAKNEEQPFYVHTSRMEIDVIGTQFNVTAYRDDDKHVVVLVKGCVDVNVHNEKSRLQPEQMLSASAENIEVKKINVNHYISWKDGFLYLTDEPLSNILKRLSYYYDIPIECEEDISMLNCNGKLVLFDDVEDVLKTIYNTLPVTYSLQENKIFIQKRETSGIENIG